MRGATRANLPDRAEIAGITVPALILAWTGDPIHPVSTADELHALIPDSELHVASTPADLASWTDLTAGFLQRVLAS
jgi:pimeloyl-ACP methyl ester carboxylesterase